MIGTVVLVKCIFYGLILLVGIIGNILVVTVVVTSKKMKSLPYLFIANLAISDLLVNFLCLPFTLLGSLFPDFFIGEILCKAISYFQGATISASANTLVAISIERYMAIVSRPFTGKMTKRQYMISVVTIWLVAFTVTIPCLFVFTTKEIKSHKGLVEICYDAWSSSMYNYSYFIVVNVFICYVGPLIIITCCNVLIWRRVNNRPLTSGVSLNNGHVIERSKIHVIKTVLLIIISFAVLWLPLYLLFCFIQFASTEVLLRKNVEEFISYFLPIAQFLAATNSCVNPIIYGFVNKKYRIEFKRVIATCCGMRRTTPKSKHLNTINLRFLKSEKTNKSSTS